MPFISGFYRPTAEDPTNWKTPSGKGWWDRFSVEEVRPELRCSLHCICCASRFTASAALLISLLLTSFAVGS